LVEEAQHGTFLCVLVEDPIIRTMKIRRPFVFMTRHQSTAYVKIEIAAFLRAAFGYKMRDHIFKEDTVIIGSKTSHFSIKTL